MPRTGRPCEFTEDTAERICSEISEGKSLRSICIPNDMPNRRTVFRWLRQFPDFCLQYDRAVEERAEYLADEIFDIADAATPEEAQVARLRIDTRKWAASKLKPKKYGDKVQQEVSGPNGQPIQTQAVEWTIQPVTPNETNPEG